MFKPQAFFRTATIVAVLFICTFTAAAQQPVAAYGQSYDVVLQVLVGSDDAQSAELPKDLTAVSKELRSRFSHTNYRVANTFLGRVSENGNLEYKSVANILKNDASGTPTFLDWSIMRLNGGADEGKLLQAEGFRFGARVPVRLPGGSPAVSYESIGLNVNRLAIAPRTATLLGTLNLPDTAGTVFLVMTVKPAIL